MFRIILPLIHTVGNIFHQNEANNALRTFTDVQNVTAIVRTIPILPQAVQVVGEGTRQTFLIPFRLGELPIRYFYPEFRFFRNQVEDQNTERIIQVEIPAEIPVSPLSTTTPELSSQEVANICQLCNVESLNDLSPPQVTNCENLVQSVSIENRAIGLAAYTQVHRLNTNMNTGVIILQTYILACAVFNFFYFKFVPSEPTAQKLLYTFSFTKTGKLVLAFPVVPTRSSIRIEFPLKNLILTLLFLSFLFSIFSFGVIVRNLLIQKYPIQNILGFLCNVSNYSIFQYLLV